MNLLQTIWSALTIPNEFLLNIIGIPLALIEITLSMLLFLSILNINSTKKQQIIYIVILTTIALLSRYFLPQEFNTIINILSLPFLVFFIFKTNLLKAILAEFIPYFIFSLLQSLWLNIYLNITNVSSEIITTVPIYNIVFCIISYILVYIVYIILKHFNINIKLLENINIKIEFSIILNILIGIIAIAIQTTILILYIDILPKSLIFSSLIILIIYFSISIHSLLRTNKLEYTKQQLEEEQLYNKTLTILYDSIRAFKHDFNNIVQAFGGYIATDDMKGLKEYYSQVLDDCQKVNNLCLLNPEIINNPAIYSLLTSKYHYADELGIKINLDVFMDLNTLNMKIYELTRILGILLDNAIEANLDCKTKTINITFRKDAKHNRQLVIVENTYSNKDIDVDRIFEKGYTSKEDKDKNSHGLGLWKIRQILRKNSNLNLHTSKNFEYFTQQLEIYL